MPKSDYIELGTGERIPILYEDRSAMVIDKPPGWMLVPFSWQKTNRNLQAALTSSIARGAFWARSRQIKFLRFAHRLDAETSGLLLLAKSPGSLAAYSDLFESRRMEKTYLAVVHGTPVPADWISRNKLAPDPDRIGAMVVDPARGKAAETRFKMLQTGPGMSLVQAEPVTGRTHQIRVQLAETGHPVVGDDLYGPPGRPGPEGLGLRAVGLAYRDPFTRRDVRVSAPTREFVSRYAFESP